MARLRKHDPAAKVKAVSATIADGTLVKEACAAHGVTAGQVREWAQSTPELSALYARAREDQAHALAESVVTLADTPVTTSEEVQQLRLRVDARKWMAAKIAPKDYGEKQTHEHGGKDGGPIVVRVVRDDA